MLMCLCWTETHSMFKRKLGYRKQAHTCQRPSFISHIFLLFIIMMCNHFPSIFAHFQYLFNFNSIFVGEWQRWWCHIHAPMHLCIVNLLRQFPKQIPLINALGMTTVAFAYIRGMCLHLHRDEWTTHHMRCLSGTPQLRLRYLFDQWNWISFGMEIRLPCHTCRLCTDALEIQLFS